MKLERAQIQRCFILCKMHRAYQPVLPCGNKYLQLKWDKAKHEEHKKRIQAAKPLVDTSAPATYSHLHLKLGKLKLEEDRLSVIERENCLLLEKMSCIMRTKGQIDNKNDYRAKSLNGEKRKQELRRVNQENRAILDRITKTQPQYQVQRWHEDWQRAEKYMANIARYPRGQCKSQSQKQQYQSALFWADKVASLSHEEPQDIYWLAQCLYLTAQYHRAAHALRSRKLDKYAAKEHQQALDILDMEEPINKRLFEKYLKDESGLKDSTTDWEMSQSSVSWFAVGCYYLMVGHKNEHARRYLRCHLPMLYIGLEYGLTNNSKLAERFFSQALSIAPEDPFVMHEVGVVAFQNGE
ncbi:cell division cycle protein 16 like protein [Limosa lapponica baueri]|uniref:Cell division cycle protein 16 like protein n=1 Tax=Limosa lapponica baueri TaxID=1758121 RepID=A0A2I0U236_LIMLA|nr:cell division cycle protein 16 like protein [Limosa lapponica baueri]